MTGSVYGRDPSGIHRQPLPVYASVPPELIADAPASLAALLATQVQNRGLCPDGTIPAAVQPGDITWTDITDPRAPNPGGERTLEINWAPRADIHPAGQSVTAALTEWLIERIPCPRCAANAQLAHLVADELARAGQPVDPPVRLGRQYWQAQIQIVACVAAGHPGVELTPDPFDPPDNAHVTGRDWDHPVRDGAW